MKYLVIATTPIRAVLAVGVMGLAGLYFLLSIALVAVVAPKYVGDLCEMYGDGIKEVYGWVKQ